MIEVSTAELLDNREWLDENILHTWNACLHYIGKENGITEMEYQIIDSQENNETGILRISYDNDPSYTLVGNTIQRARITEDAALSLGLLFLKKVRPYKWISVVMRGDRFDYVFIEESGIRSRLEITGTEISGGTLKRLHEKQRKFYGTTLYISV